jgi:hypothetical protein
MPGEFRIKLVRVNDAYLSRKYGINTTDYARLLIDQAGKCAICGDILKGDKSTHVEHCHTTGVVRSLSCLRCNTALGLFRENVEIMERAIAYLKTHRRAYYEKIEAADAELDGQLW